MKGNLLKKLLKKWIIKLPVDRNYSSNTNNLK